MPKELFIAGREFDKLRLKTYKAALIKPRLYTIKHIIRVQKQTQTDFHTWAGPLTHTLPSDYFPLLVHQTHLGV